jgi:predicted metal-dependent peptidase
MNQNARNTLIKSRVNMLLKHPFWGPLAARLQLEEADDWLTTLATDGRKFYYNSEFVSKMSDGENVFGFGHEIGHIIFEHLGRKGDRDPGLWNMAGDYIINNMLIREQVGTPITTVPILADRKYEGKTADEVYDDLFSNATKVEATLDEHLDMDGKGNGSAPSRVKEGKGQPQFKPMTEEEKKQLRNEWRDAVLNAAKSAGNQTPAEVKRLIKQLTEPVMDIKDLLRIQFSGSLKHDFSWMRPNRKGWHMSAVLPGHPPGEELDIVVALDASGSIDDVMVTDFLSMVQGALDEFASYRVRVITFDTRVYNEDTFTSDDGRSLGEYEVYGGGGTEFMCVWNWMEENDIQPHQLVMFTDGYPWGSWGDPNYCDTLFVVHGSNEIQAPFGITANYVPPAQKRAA